MSSLPKKAPAKSYDWISASELSTFVFCPEAWRLEYGLMRAPTPEAVEQRATGTAQHAEWQVVEQKSHKMLNAARLILAAAIAWWLLTR